MRLPFSAARKPVGLLPLLSLLNAPICWRLSRINTGDGSGSFMIMSGRTLELSGSLKMMRSAIIT
eukprot:6894666-Prymnesium_polylepis.1